MIKEVFKHMDLTMFAEIALALFFFVFVASAIRVFTRSRTEMNDCAELPLKD